MIAMVTVKQKWAVAQGLCLLVTCTHSLTQLLYTDPPVSPVSAVERSVFALASVECCTERGRQAGRRAGRQTKRQQKQRERQTGRQIETEAQKERVRGRE